MKRILFLLIFCLGIIPAAQACSCAPQTPQEYFNQADAVFVGKVLEVNSAWGQQEVEFEILKFEKADSEDDKEVTVYTALDDAQCGYTFVKGGVYQVFVNLVDDRLVTDLCSGNQRLKRLE